MGHLYISVLDFLVVDQGTAYTLQEMKSSQEAFGARLDEAPLETLRAIGAVE